MGSPKQTLTTNIIINKRPSRLKGIFLISESGRRISWGDSSHHSICFRTIRCLPLFFFGFSSVFSVGSRYSDPRNKVVEVYNQGRENCQVLGVKPRKHLAEIVANLGDRQIAFPNLINDEGFKWLIDQVQFSLNYHIS
ncbi:hypothetical protein H4Q26_013430 [Puccinia striiformis f. sp. tritici PST-130]|nr:hypothetical protein H4Q26_013430 [Puccinia striiformis f. sp. tritici PST-130]